MEKEKLTNYEKEIIEKIRGGQVLCVIKSISKSGMTRKMKFFTIDSKGELHRITHLISKTTSFKLDKNDCLIVKGCGMDMGFHVLSNFNYKMAEYDTGKTIVELLKTKECGERIYDKYFFDANAYTLL